MAIRGAEPAGAGPAEPLPYEGVRILDFTHEYGAYAGRLFADLGAEVIRVEPPGGLPDRLRAQAAGGFDARFEFFNASKKSLVLDPGRPRDMARLEGLVGGSAMVLVERGGPLFDATARLAALNPSAVIVAVSPFGMTGPMADAPASDLVLQAAGGIAWMSGRIGEAPLSLPFDQATMVGSIYAATVAAIALADAERTGRGHLIDVSVQECIAHSLQNAIQVLDLEDRVSTRGGLGTRDATENIFPCRDGYVFLASPLALGPSFANLAGWMREEGHPSGAVLSDSRWQDREWRLTAEAHDAFRAAFSAFSAGFDRETITHEALRRRIVMGPVSRISDVFEDPQIVHRGFFASAGLSGAMQPGFPGAPYRLSPPLWRTSPAPSLGEHDAMLAEAAQ